MQNKFVILALLGLASANQPVNPQVQAKPAQQPTQKAAAQKPVQQQNQPKPTQKAQGMIQKKGPVEDAQMKTSGQNIEGPKRNLSHALDNMKANDTIWGMMNSKAAIHEDIRSQARQMEIAPPSMEAIKKNMWVPDAAELLADNENVQKLMKDVRMVGGASGKQNKAEGMNDADAACYTSRYSDLKDKPARDHFRLIGDKEGRLETCARELSDQEAVRYLHTFPELQTKFGDGPSAVKQARKHWRDIGHKTIKFNEKMKDTEKTAWKCGEGAKQACKCHGTLWYGATTRPDDKKPIETWEKMREWKTLTKQSEEWMSCTDANFGSDPWPNQEKQCWCEPKEAYKPWKCADEGDECLCEGGWVVYGAKADADKKENDFFGMIKLSLAITGTKGKRSVVCEAGTFEGADPAPGADKMCMCDAESKYFDSSFVKATKAFWRASQVEKQSEGELKRTGAHGEEVVKITKEREASATEAVSAQKVENEKAIEDIGKAKQCAIQAIEESYKFRKAKVQQKKALLEKTIGKRRAQITGWTFQMNVKKNSAEHACAQASRKSTNDRARAEAECARLNLEIDELATQIQVEMTKISEEEKSQTQEIRTEETQLESKRTKETIAVEEKADEDINEVNEGSTEKELDIDEEKEALLQQQQELIKIQQKTSKVVENSVKDQQGAINILIDNLRKKLTKTARKEEILISELSDDAPERKTVTDRIIKRSKETVEKLTKVQDELKEKKEKISKDTAGLKDDIKGMTEKLSAIQAKIMTSQESLKSKIAERTSKKSLVAQYAGKSGMKTGAVGSAVSVEGALVTQGAVDKLTKEITEEREKIKKNIQQKNEFFSTKITTQKQIDLQTNQVKTIEEQLKNIKTFIAEVETTIETVETRTKEEEATKKVVEAQKDAFKAVQKKIDAEEAVNSHRVVSEKKKDHKTAETKDCKKEFDLQTAGVKTLEDQLKTIKKTASDSKGSKDEKARLDTEAEGVEKQVDEAKKELDKVTKECKDLDEDLKKIVDESKEKIEKLTKKVEEAKEEATKTEKDAKEAIADLPGGVKEIEKIMEEKKEEEKKEAKETKTTTGVAVSTSSSASSKTSTGKTKAPNVPAPKRNDTKPAEPEDKIPIAPLPAQKPIKIIGGNAITDDDEDDGEPADVNPTEVPGGEAQITKEVQENTKTAHNARVELVKAKENAEYELETIKNKLKKFSEAIKDVRKGMEASQSEIKSENAKLESMKTSAITAKLKDTNKQELEIKIQAQVQKIQEIEAKITKGEATLIEYKGKVTALIERRKEIKYEVEVKSLESKEAEAAVTEAIKTVTDVELLTRKRFIASESVGSYKKCQKYMTEYKQIYEKQAQVMASEIADHGRRNDVADGAITSLKEKKKLLDDVKKTPEVENKLAMFDSEIERHEKVVKAEGKILDAIKEKKEKNKKDYDEHMDKCAKAKKKALVATAGVNDAATTLKNQREFQVQVTSLKGILVSSHEEALAKRQEATKMHQNYTNMITKFEQQTSITNEQIMDSKTKISGAQEIQRIIAVRMKEIGTLLSRPSITVSEKTKLQTEEASIRAKMESQQNTVDQETNRLVTLETSLATLGTTVKTFKNHIKEIKEIIKTLDKKVTETKKALKDPNGAPEKPKEEEKDAEDKDKDEDGDLKIEDEDAKEEEAAEKVKGGNEKIDKELDQIEEENKSTTTQIDSLTKTITTVEEKSEAADKEVVKETTDTAKEDAELAEVHEHKLRLTRVRERQRCARLFPVAFSSFKIGVELKSENMCPCPGKGKGLTMLYLENIKDSSEFDKYVLGLFEKNLAVEGSFQQQMVKLTPGTEGKVAENGSDVTMLKLVVQDDKIDMAMDALDAQNLSKKSTDFKISPLLKGKAEYQKWQAAAAAKPTNTKVHIGQELEEEIEEELD